MNQAPVYPSFPAPAAFHWRRWWLVLAGLWGGQCAALLLWWPPGQARLQWWLWSAILPLGWALALGLRLLVRELGLLNQAVYHRQINQAVRHWWQRRSLGLPVRQVLLLGPVGDEQCHFEQLMARAPLPQPRLTEGAMAPGLPCPVTLASGDERAPALARHLAGALVRNPELKDCWPHVRGIAWAGDSTSLTAFVEALAAADVLPAQTHLPLHDLDELDDVIDAFHQGCCEIDDWLLCAGIASAPAASGPSLPGEAGFAWQVGWQARAVLHRGEYLVEAVGDSPVQLCQQVQRYAGLAEPPSHCLALDATSHAAGVAGGWPASARQLGQHWGDVGHLGPFIGMSLALLQAQETGQPCGWLSQATDLRLAMGVATAHGDN